ncbi:MAG: PadR family transcriptional regulator [Candidatus Dormibacteraeota bacterium]|nr:PadR family transcriptional regulator [Candidatus Dormibacteraeota bacterium]
MDARPEFEAEFDKFRGAKFHGGRPGPGRGPLGRVLMTGGRRGPWGFGRGSGMPFGGFGGGFRGPGWRGPRVGRGDVRAAVLALLSERPLNGYQIMQELAQRSRGIWRPSPGSVYPALQQLEDEGLVRAEEREGRRVFLLTDSGRAYVEEHRGEYTAPWDAVSDSVDEGLVELRDLAFQVAGAVMQVAHAGSEAQVARAKAVLGDARRALYRILAEDEPSTDS